MHHLLFFFVKHFIRFFPKTTIPVHGKPYLTRYFLLLRDWKWFGIYIHHFHMSDPDRELHNHPWTWGWSYILKGGYDQTRKLAGKNRVPVWSFYYPGNTNLITKDVYHKVTLHDEEAGAWTLFIVGPRYREWDFLDPDSGDIKSRQEVNPESIA